MTRIWTLISLLALASCRRVCGDDVYPAIDDDRVPPVAALVDPADPRAFGDLVAGNGRVSQEGRRMLFLIVVTDSGASPLGEGEVTVQSPIMGYDGNPTSATGLAALVGQFTGGMRVGGVRRGPARPFPSHCRTVEGDQCQLAPWLTVPLEREVIITAELKSVCTPRYCRTTFYSIPASRTTRVAEQSCK